MRSGVLDLDDLACRDVRVAGAKAAALSRARSLGLPVLPGYVVTTEASLSALSAGKDALAVRGSGGARLAVQSSALPGGLHEGLTDAVTDLAGPVIVRSSSTVEGSGEWSGAFSSFAEIDAATVVTATKGCWASLFGVDVLERAEHTGIEVDDVGMAALIQPMVSPEVSGHARLAGGTVHVTAVRGTPAGLMSGWVTGSEVSVSSAGEATGPGLELLTADQACDVAGLTRRCADLLDHQTVEWALVDGAVVLLQSTEVRRDAERPVLTGIARLEELDDPIADRVAELVRRFPGGLSEELVLPWAVGLRDPRVLAAAGSAAARDQLPGPVGLDDLRRRAESLASLVWGDASGTAPWRATLRDLRSDRPGEALRQLTALRPPPLEESLDVLLGLLAIGADASRRGSLRRPEEILGGELADLQPGRAINPRQSWAGARRWEPFLAAVAQTRGSSAPGVPAAPGVGAGGVRVVHGIEAAGHATHARSVVVATHPIPSLAPLLWNAAALVTTQGSLGAHLLEVAHSLGVPAVVQCDGLPLAALAPGTVLAVDGDSGQVSWHDPLGR